MMNLICSQSRNSTSPSPPAPSAPLSTRRSPRPLPPIPTQKLYESSTPPYRDLVLQLKQPCKICATEHLSSELCPSKPRFHPDRLYPACDICNGHHPPGRCYFEYLRKNLSTPSPCQYCKGLKHIGFCHGTLLCHKCKTKHNSADGCVKRELHDFSNNFCPRCKTVHINHCRRDLVNITIPNILWCNFCKLYHQFMKCTPFCNKCFRHHLESFTCPDPHDFCSLCQISHFGLSCPRTSTTNLELIQQQLRSPPQPPNTPKYRAPARPEPEKKKKTDSDYFCPDDCSCPACAPVRFIKSPVNLTPLPSFNEELTV